MLPGETFFVSAPPEDPGTDSGSMPFLSDTCSSEFLFVRVLLWVWFRTLMRVDSHCFCMSYSHTLTCTDRQTHTQIIHAQTDSDGRTDTHKNTHTHTHTLSLSHTHTHTYSRTQARTRTHTHIHKRTYTYTHNIAHTHTHSLTRTHTHTPHTHTQSTTMQICMCAHPRLTGSWIRDRLLMVAAPSMNLPLPAFREGTRAQRASARERETKTKREREKGGADQEERPREPKDEKEAAGWNEDKCGTQRSRDTQDKSDAQDAVPRRLNVVESAGQIRAQKTKPAKKQTAADIAAKIRRQEPSLWNVSSSEDSKDDNDDLLPAESRGARVNQRKPFRRGSVSSYAVSNGGARSGSPRSMRSITSGDDDRYLSSMYLCVRSWKVHYGLGRGSQSFPDLARYEAM